VTPPEVLSDGHQLAEAPRVGPDGAVWFTDVLGGGVRRWTEDGGVEVVVAKRRGVGGLALHADGGVVMGGKDVVHVAPDGAQRTVFERPGGVVGFNDLCALPTGALLVGALRWAPFGADADPERVPGEFWHVGPGGDEPSIDIPGITWANGCGVDAGRGRTYACDYATGTVWVRDVEGLRRFAEVPGGEADGLAVDGEGGVWVATARGGSIVRLDPDTGRAGDDLRVGDFVSSLAFDGGAWLYVTTMTSLLRLPAPVAGPRHLLATV
jgi:gluconolactonase